MDTIKFVAIFIVALAAVIALAIFWHVLVILVKFGAIALGISLFLYFGWIAKKNKKKDS